MILSNPNDVYHKLQLYRLLIKVLDDKELAQNLYFKGGTCASMLGWLDRFSIDLDFDLDPKSDYSKIKSRLLFLFKANDFEIVKQAENTPFFILQYQSNQGLRNNLKFGVVKNTIKANKYQSFYLPEVDRYAICQTQGTMVANKLVALTDRFDKYKTIAGRDLYDIHFFLSHSFSYNPEVIKERTKLTTQAYFEKLHKFIEEKITTKIIDEDLNYLLPPDKFQTIRKMLKIETLLLVKNEISKIKYT